MSDTHLEKDRLVEALVSELEADRLLWQSMVDQLPSDHHMHAMLGLRIASIDAVLQKAKP